MKNGIKKLLIILGIVFVAVGGFMICLLMPRIKKAVSQTLNHNMNDMVENIHNMDKIEASLTDSDYYETIELALFSLITEDPNNADAYACSMDKIIYQHESDDYLSVFYFSEKDETHGCLSWMKFKKKQFGNKTKYASLKWRVNTDTASMDLPEQQFGAAFLQWYGKSNEAVAYSNTFEGKIQIQLIHSDLCNEIANVYPDERRFLFGNIQDERVYKMKLEGLAPTGIIPYELYGETCYFFYYEDFESDKPAEQIEVIIE